MEEGLYSLTITKDDYETASKDVTVEKGKISMIDFLFNPVNKAPIAITGNASGITQTTATLDGTVNANGTSTSVVFEYGTTTSYGNTANPTPATVIGNEATSVSVNLTGLTINVTYHYRIKAENVSGISYGNDLTFTTALFSLPIVTTSETTNITSSTAKCEGNITSNGGATILQRGICYATTANPTTDNNTLVASGTTGIFTCNLSGLTANTIYYIRSYAVNSVGTAY